MSGVMGAVRFTVSVLGSSNYHYVYRVYILAKVAFSLFIWYAYYYKAWFRTAPRGCPGEIPGCMFTERKFGRDI